MASTKKLKYAVNFRPEVPSAKSGNWQCEKCDLKFYSFNALKSHKGIVHSY